MYVTFVVITIRSFRLFHDLSITFKESNTKGVTIGAGTTYPFGIPVFCEVQIVSSKVVSIDGL